MIKILLFLFSLNLFAQETCYTIQLFSKTNSPENAVELQKTKFPDSCKIMTVNNFLTVRCGCYEGYSVAQQKLSALKRESADATIITTNKSRFADTKAIVTPKELNSTKEEPIQVSTEINATKESVIENKTLASKELNATLAAKPKPIKSLSEDPLFHANRESGLGVFEAMQRAIELSPKLGAAYEVVVQDKKKVEEVEAGHLPTVDFSGDAGYEEREVMPDTLETKDPALTTRSRYKKTDLYLTITENLWAGGSIENSVDEKDANLKASLFDYRDKLESLVLDVANAYFNVVYSEIALKISNKNMRNYEKILNIVTIKEKNGAATTGDVNFIRANVDNARTELVQKEKNLKDAISNYIYLLQTDTNDTLPYEAESPLYIADLNTSLEEAHAYNAKLLKQRSYIKATTFGFLSTKGTFHPRVDLSLYGESKNEFDIGLGQREKVNALVTFNYNLYSGGKDEATAARLLSKMREQKYLYKDLERNIVFDINVLNSSVSSLSQSLKLTENEVLAARKVVDSYWVAFKNGTQDLQALQLAQRNLNSAEQSYAKYKKDLILNNYALMQKTGALLKFLEIPYKKNASEFESNFNLFYQFSDLE